MGIQYRAATVLVATAATIATAAASITGCATIPRHRVAVAKLQVADGVPLTTRLRDLLDRELRAELFCIESPAPTASDNVPLLRITATKATLKGHAAQIRRIDLSLELLSSAGGSVLHRFDVHSAGIAGPADIVFGGGAKEGFLTDAAEELAERICPQVVSALKSAAK